MSHAFALRLLQGTHAIRVTLDLAFERIALACRSDIRPGLGASCWICCIADDVLYRSLIQYAVNLFGEYTSAAHASMLSTLCISREQVAFL